LITQKLEAYDPFRIFITFDRSLDTLSWLLDSTDSEWRQRGVIDRLIFALFLCIRREKVFLVRDPSRAWSGTILQLMLQRDELSEELCAAGITFGPYPHPSETLLTVAVKDLLVLLSSWVPCNQGLLFSGIRASDLDRRGCLFNPEIIARINRIKELIRLKSDIHQVMGSFITCTTATILFSVLMDYEGPKVARAETTTNKAKDATNHIAIRIWLEILLEAGVDLVEYGKKEHDWFCKTQCIEANRERYSESHYYQYSWEVKSELHLISFSYGPRPDDWIFRFVSSEEYYGYYRIFREFWDMVDHPERATPGAWDAAPQWEFGTKGADWDILSDSDWDDSYDYGSSWG
jgi:hypothetical protein